MQEGAKYRDVLGKSYILLIDIYGPNSTELPL